MHSVSSVAVLVAAVSYLPLVIAHGYVSGVVSDGQYYSGTSPNWIYGQKPDTAGWYAKNQDNGFVGPETYGSGDIVCHKSAEVGGAPVPVTAGGKVDLQWNTWPESHHGPVITYMAPVAGDFASSDKTSLQWFKVAEGGLVDGSASPGVWASDEMMANNNTASFTVPSSLKSGNYVVRHEIIALHSAGQQNGAQNYPQCINVKVSGSGSDVPSGVVGTSLYKATDPGIMINIYTTLSDYTIPGPAMASGGGSGSGSGSGDAGEKPSLSSSAPAPVATVTSSAVAYPTATSSTPSKPTVTQSTPSKPTVTKSTPSKPTGVRVPRPWCA